MKKLETTSALSVADVMTGTEELYQADTEALTHSSKQAFYPTHLCEIAVPLSRHLTPKRWKFGAAATLEDTKMGVC